MRKSISANADRMMAAYSTQKKLVNSPEYWVTYARAYFFYKESMQLDYNGIVGKFDNYNDTIKQYVKLRCLKDGIIDQQGKLSPSHALDKFTYPPFKEAAAKYLGDPNLGNELSHNLNSILRNTEIFDANSNKLQFFDIFINTKQRYILFDFCGTWCVPCLEEIARYAEKQPLNNSTKVRPVWLFFENDSSKWMVVIEKYKLKKENCFIMLDRKFINVFAKNFNWGQEFPHHFVFTREGKITDEKAPPMADFDQASLLAK